MARLGGIVGGTLGMDTFVALMCPPKPKTVGPTAADWVYDMILTGNSVCNSATIRAG
jgi:hypothetical protein